MRLEGSLDTFGLSDIFTLLSMTSKSGALHLTGDGVEAVVHFRDGAITSAVSDRTRQALARRLVATGAVNAATLARATESLDTADDRTANDGTANDGAPHGLVSALTKMAKVAPDVLRNAAEEQILDAVFDLLRWPDGTFAFDVAEVDPDDVDVRQPVDDVLARARQRLDSWANRKTSVPTRDTVLSMAAAISDDVSVSPPEWAVLALVDGVRSVAELCDLAGRGEYVTVTTLADLADRGLVHADAAGVRAVVERQRALARWERRDRTAAPPATEGEAPAGSNGAVPLARRAERGRSSNGTPRRAPAAKETPPADDPEATLVPAGEAVPEVAARAGGAGDATTGRPGAFASAASANGGGPSAPPGFIERDPSVNKSLLLRLIAGVRGL